MNRIGVFLVVVFFCPPLFAEDEPPRVPLRSTCQMTTNEAQEARYCKAWRNILEKASSFRPAEGTETSISYHIMVMWDTEYDIAAVSHVVVLETSSLNGFTPIVWNRVNLVRPEEFIEDVQIAIVLSLKAIINWLPGAVEAVDNLCPPEPKRYKSVEVEGQ